MTTTSQARHQHIYTSTYPHTLSLRTHPHVSAHARINTRRARTCSAVGCDTAGQGRIRQLLQAVRYAGLSSPLCTGTRTQPYICTHTRSSSKHTPTRTHSWRARPRSGSAVGCDTPGQGRVRQLLQAVRYGRGRPRVRPGRHASLQPIRSAPDHPGPNMVCSLSPPFYSPR